MYAATNVNSTQSFQSTASPPKSVEQLGIKVEENYGDDDFYENKATNQGSSEIFDSIQEQKLLNNAFDMINFIESSLQNTYDNTNSENSDEKFSSSFINSLVDENTTQFRIQLPQILHPKMQVCEIGSRILFKTIDWLRENELWRQFETDDQKQMLQLNWAELLVIGLSQVIQSSSQSLQTMIISTLVNYVKSLIIYSTNETHQLKTGKKEEGKSAIKIKKMLNHISLIKKFIDEINQLRKIPAKVCKKIGY